MLKLDHVTVSFKDKIAVELRSTLEISDGDRVGIIGSNGAGKTTLIKSILGIVPYGGQIQTSLPREKIAVHMQQNEYSSLVSIQVLLETVLGDRLDRLPQVQELIDFFDFRTCLKKKWKHLSGGQKQRLTLILVMCQESPLTILDEVTSGLDFETRQKLMEKLALWFDQRKSTLLITSHYYEELDRLADKILFLDQGHVIDYGPKKDLFFKYCGRSVLVAEESEETLALAASHPVIAGKPGSIVFRCDNPAAEEDLTTALIHLGTDFRCSHNDIELMTINAKNHYYKEAN